MSQFLIFSVKSRKTLLGVSALGVSVCLFALGTFYYLKSIGGVQGFGWLPLADFLIYIGFFMVNIKVQLENYFLKRILFFFLSVAMVQFRG